MVCHGGLKLVYLSHKALSTLTKKIRADGHYLNRTTSQACVKTSSSIKQT